MLYKLVLTIGADTRQNWCPSLTTSESSVFPIPYRASLCLASTQPQSALVVTDPRNIPKVPQSSRANSTTCSHHASHFLSNGQSYRHPSRIRSGNLERLSNVSRFVSSSLGNNLLAVRMISCPSSTKVPKSLFQGSFH
jgi:hypothetical protein